MCLFKAIFSIIMSYNGNYILKSEPSDWSFENFIWTPKIANVILNIVWQNPLFYVLSDDPDWATSNIVDEGSHIFYAGSEDPMGQPQLSPSDGKGEKHFYQMYHFLFVTTSFNWWLGLILAQKYWLKSLSLAWANSYSLWLAIRHFNNKANK